MGFSHMMNEQFTNAIVPKCLLYLFRGELIQNDGGMNTTFVTPPPAGSTDSNKNNQYRGIIIIIINNNYYYNTLINTTCGVL